MSLSREKGAFTDLSQNSMSEKLTLHKISFRKISIFTKYPARDKISKCDSKFLKKKAAYC